jgi:hypothetical protein
MGWATQLFRFNLLLTLMFSAAIGLLRAQPNHSHDLQTLLVPDTCPQPCILGIRPGQTQLKDVVSLLEAHPWIESVRISNDVAQTGTGRVTWTWNGGQSAWIDDSKEARVWLRLNVVREVVIASHIALGDGWLLLGQPMDGGYGGFMLTASGRQVIHDARWFQGYLNLRSVVACPIHTRDFWGASTEIYLANFEVWAGHYQRPNQMMGDLVCRK